MTRCYCATLSERTLTSFSEIKISPPKIFYDFTWHKYGVGSYATEALLRVHSLEQLVRAAQELLRAEPRTGANNLTTHINHRGEVNAVPHHIPRGCRRIVPRTDNLLRPASLLCEPFRRHNDPTLARAFSTRAYPPDLPSYRRPTAPTSVPLSPQDNMVPPTEEEPVHHVESPLHDFPFGGQESELPPSEPASVLMSPPTRNQFESSRWHVLPAWNG